MYQIPHKIKSIVDVFKDIANNRNINIYIFKDITNYIVTGNNTFLSNKSIDLVADNNISYSDVRDIFSSSFNDVRDIFISDDKYSFYCNSIYVTIWFHKNFDVHDISNIRCLCTMTFESIFYDILHNKIIDPCSGSIDIANPDHIAIRFVSENSMINLEDAISAAKCLAEKRFYLDDNIKNVFSNCRLSSLRKPINISINHLISKVISSIAPGKSLKFLCETFVDGYQWVFNRLSDYLVSANISINENSTIPIVLCDTKFDLIDSYNSLFLFNKEQAETIDDAQRRMSSTMRLLYDSPSIEIPKPFIEHVSVLNVNDNIEAKIRAFEGYGCEYGNCPECVPSKCGDEPGGFRCCCCHEINYIADMKCRCHKEIMASCDSTGTKPGPNDEPFSAECDSCFEACDKILNTGTPCDFPGDPLPDWWQFPIDILPCECFCREGYWSDGCEGCGTCELNCVTCNEFCCSDVNVEVGDCAFRISLTPGNECCTAEGDKKPKLDIVFCICGESTMAGLLEPVKQKIIRTVDNLSNLGVNVRAGLIRFPELQNFSPVVLYDFSDNTIDGFKDHVLNDMSELYLSNFGESPDIYAAWQSAADNRFFNFSDGYIVVIGNQVSNIKEGSPTYQQTLDACNLKNLKVICIDDQNNPAVERRDLANSTGGIIRDITSDFENIVYDIEIRQIPVSCDCLDYTPIYIKLAGTDIIDIPIAKCVKDDLSDCDCGLEQNLDICGTIVTIQPEAVNMVCCHEIGFGCECPQDPCKESSCCGPPDYGSKCFPICNFPTAEAAAIAVWCECFAANVVINPTTCSDCTIENCCLQVPDGNCDFSEVCKDQIEESVKIAYKTLCEVPATTPPPDWDCSNVNCERIDECIVGSPTGPFSETDKRCEDAHAGCVSIRNPSVIILNNGIGLVAYESLETISVIKIQQFHTSIISKLLPNREFNHGRLQNIKKWTTNPVVCKLYYYDENISSHFLTGISSPGDPSTWKDAIGFKNGPLQNKCFPLYAPEGGVPYGEDTVGKFIIFLINSVDINSVTLSNEFPSSDDVYNIRWFIYNQEDQGLIGDISQIPGAPESEFLIDGRDSVDAIMQLPKHIYNGEPVPVSYPSMSTAYNYMNAVENSHFIYLTYQALEDGKWNVYLRQIRLSEYEKEEQIEQAEFITLNNLGISNVIYRVFCVNDSCKEFGSDFMLSRSVTMEVVLSDGREVYNNGFIGNWTALCPGEPESSFPRQKVFVTLTHSVSADRCPDQFSFDDIFYNWNVSDEFSVPVDINTDTITPQLLFSIMSINSDSAVTLGEFNPPLSKGGVLILSSQVGAVWYEKSTISEWVVINNESFNTLLKYKGIDVDEPILLTENDTGHATHPVVKVNYNNDVFIAYESTETGIQQINIIGTATPSSSLPNGVFRPKDIDRSLNYFYTADDFIYKKSITQFSNRINQLPDMFIDFNDVIHLTWQSNRDYYWEIYYARSDQDFSNTRITNYKSRSFKPRIDGDEKGRIYIVWHDDRFVNWEIMMAYFDGNRILPLSQQDPYLASMRNFSEGWLHSSEIIPLYIKNNSATTKCYSDFIVSFYEDRLLENFAFKIKYSEWPFAFVIGGSQTDTSIYSFDDLESGDAKFNSWTYVIESSDPYVGTVFVSTSPEFDTLLLGSAIVSITKESSIDPEVMQISFRASDLINDSLSDAQWTSWINILEVSNGTKIPYADLTSSEVQGRYKQVRIRYQDAQNPYFDNPVSKLIIESASSGRLCLAPGEEKIIYLDLTPEVRIDSAGTETQESAISIGLSRNNTYFVGLQAIDDNGVIYTFNDQKRSVSCESCTNKVADWDTTSCSIITEIINSSDVARYYNVRVQFYSDKEKFNGVAQFNAFYGADLEYFTVAENLSAEAEWTERGYRVPGGSSLLLSLWPMLSNKFGLLCGVSYWVEISICYTDESSAQLFCGPSSLLLHSFESWKCDCQSVRWNTRFENAPVNIRDVIRWNSSADGLSDTRITETINVQNFNPSIKMRSNLDGVIVYESNRESAKDDIYKVYASIFSIVPSSNMYATGAESIISPFDQVLIHSDVPICIDGGCVDPDKNILRPYPTLDGRSISFDLDQYDNIFLASEVQFDQRECNEFIRNKSQIVKVHRCGADAQDLFFGHEKTESSIDTGACKATEIVEKFETIPTDNTFKSIIKMVRVDNQFVRYHITYNNKPAPVVDVCSIILQIIGSPETIAVRLRNEEGEWSEWIPFEPETGDYAMNLTWTLSKGSGIKDVDIQAASYQGLVSVYDIKIIADYNKAKFTTNFYKLPKNSTIKPPDPVDVTSAELFQNQDILPQLEGIPVAALRFPEILDGNILLRNEDYILVEIIPANLSESDLTPIFDFIHQGGSDQFGVLTQKVNTVIDGKTSKISYRASVIIKSENNVSHKDGLAFIIPHFPEDCADSTSVSGGSYTRDTYNLIDQGKHISDTEFDIWSNNRDNITGAINYKITLRPSEDPYFIFGDPNYRHKRDQE